MIMRATKWCQSDDVQQCTERAGTDGRGRVTWERGIVGLEESGKTRREGRKKERRTKGGRREGRKEEGGKDERRREGPRRNEGRTKARKEGEKRSKKDQEPRTKEMFTIVIA